MKYELLQASKAAQAEDTEVPAEWDALSRLLGISSNMLRYICDGRPNWLVRSAMLSPTDAEPLDGCEDRWRERLRWMASGTRR